MKKLESGRTEYQEFLYSLFIKYGIDSPDELWSNSVWKVIVDNRVSNYARENFYKELSEFNIKNPSDENWTHTSDKKLEEIKTKDENDEIREKTEAEFNRRKIKETQINVKGKENLEEVESEEEIKEKREKSARHLASNSEVKIAYAIGKEKRIADAKKAEEESIAAAKKVEEESIAAAKKENKEVEMSDEIQTNDNEEDLLKECPYCAEDIKKKAIKCKHCGESLEEQVANPIQSNSNTESIKSEPTYAPSTTKIVIERPDTATLGIVSLVIGLIGIFFISFILSPIALLFGIFSLMKDDSKVWGILGIIFAIIGAITSPILMGLLSLATYSSY